MAKSLATLSLMAAAVTAAPAGKRLISFGDHQEWLSEEAIEQLAHNASDVGFVDVTNFKDMTHMKIPGARNDRIPDAPHQKEAVDRFINLLCGSNGSGCSDEVVRIGLHMEDASNYFNRWYTTTDSRDAVMWLRDEYIKAAGSRLGDDVTIELFEHSWVQPSLIVRIPGTVNPTEVVVLGGHIDSTAGGANARAPGFDDDATGSGTVFAAFKALMDGNFKPERTLEFHAYAAEEAGLRGSQAMAQDYRARAVDVVTMTQFDMTCYSPNREVGLTNDFTDSTLTAFIGQLLDDYTAVKGVPSTCGYGCSDHASFTAQGYPAAFPFEAPFALRNPNIHTSRDTEDKCDFQYMGEFAKMAVAYAVEMGTIER